MERAGMRFRPETLRSTAEKPARLSSSSSACKIYNPVNQR
jgi:hypothetical protein